MATLWRTLREEVRGTMDEFKEKGIRGTLRDAALDARDMLADAGGAVVDSAGAAWKSVGAGDTGPVLRCSTLPSTLPEPGSKVELEPVEDAEAGEEVEIVALDTVSSPPRAKVKRVSDGELLVVSILSPEACEERKEAMAAMKKQQLQATDETAVADTDVVGKAADKVGQVLDGLQREVKATVDDFREKGAVGAIRDATADAVDLVKGAATATAATATATAGAAVEGAKGTAAGPVIDRVHREFTATVDDFREKGAVGALRDATADAVDLVRDTAGAAVEGAKGTAAGPVLDRVHREFTATVDDFREKGAVGALRDATADAVDLVRDTAGAAVEGAKVLAETTTEIVTDKPAVHKVEGVSRGATLDDWYDKGGPAVRPAGYNSQEPVSSTCGYNRQMTPDADSSGRIGKLKLPTAAPESVNNAAEFSMATARDQGPTPKKTKESRETTAEESEPSEESTDERWDDDKNKKEEELID